MNSRFVTTGIVFTLLATVFVVGPTSAAMTSTNYEIRFDHVGFGGDDTSSSASYQLRDSVGGNALDRSTSTSYTLAPGYREGIFDEVATFQLLIMSRGTQTGATALSSNTVTVNSTAQISEGNKILIVQNEGANQKTAMGEVTGIAGLDVTIDFQTQSNGALTIDGSNDVVYTMNGSTLSLGTITSSTMATGAIGWEVDADVDDGFGIYVYENRDFAVGGDAEDEKINDVADGTVTVGQNEYGARSTDTSLTGSAFDTTDAAFTTAFQLIGSRTDNALKARDYLTLKVSAAESKASGTYSHTLTFVYVGDY